MRQSALALLALTACLQSPPADQMAAPERDRVEVAVALAKARATDRVVAAFVAESLLVASAEGGVVRSEPVELKSLGMVISQVTYTATVVGAGPDSSRVVVAAYEQPLERRGAALENARASDRKRNVTSHDKAMFIPHWRRVERIAAAVGAR